MGNKKGLSIKLGKELGILRKGNIIVF